MSPLMAAAFGPEPGCWPLPPAAGPQQLWLRAVAAGGQGRYACANAALTELLRARSDQRWASLALSTRASFLRQLGWHWHYGNETANHFDHVHIATDGGGYPTGRETYYLGSMTNGD